MAQDNGNLLARLKPRDYTGTCWWCGGKADSREHRHKASDLRREFAAPEYAGGDVAIVRGDEENLTLRGPKSDKAKFGLILCARCNNQRSQPYDNAYDRFIEWYLHHEREVERTRVIRLDTIFGDWRTGRTDLLSYFVKHVGCRIADLDFEVPGTLRDFLDRRTAPLGLVLSFELNGIFVGINRVVKEHPTAHGTAGNLWLGPIEARAPRADPTDASSVNSYWGYHGLQVVWQWSIDPEVTWTNLGQPRTRLPFVDRQASRALPRVVRPGLRGAWWRGWYRARQMARLAPYGKPPAES